MAEEEQTCGKGLAQNSVLPARLGELTAALADVLEAHTEALDLSDENSRAEHEVYERIAHQLRDAAAQLEVAALEMARQQDLPIGRHDMEALAAGDQPAAFERYVRVERELPALLQEKLTQDEETLNAMRRD